MTAVAPIDAPSPQSAFGGYVRGLWARREFAWYLATSSLKARNSTTSLGILWWVLNPLLLTGVYFLVFGVIFGQGRRGDPDYLAYLMSGMFAFQFTAGVTTSAAQNIISNSKLIVNLRFPRLVLPISSIFESGIGFLVSLVVFFAIVIPLTPFRPGVAFLLFVPILIIHLLLNLGLASVAARLAVPFRDVANLIPYLMRMWLYLSPIIWPIELLDEVPAWVADAMYLNPMYNILSLYRTALLGWEFDPLNLVGAAASAVIIGILGTITFVRFEGKMVQYL